MEYNRGAAIAYAKKWAFSRNPLYVNFDTMGGDCTNFISQCLYAGHPEMNHTQDTGWYYQNGYQRSPSWTGVEFLYRFLVTNGGPGPRASVASPASAQPGDIIQLGNRSGRYFHSLLLIALDDEEAYIAAHTHDAWMQPLSSYGSEQIRFLHIL